MQRNLQAIHLPSEALTTANDCFDIQHFDRTYQNVGQDQIHSKVICRWVKTLINHQAKRSKDEFDYETVVDCKIELDVRLKQTADLRNNFHHFPNLI
jgi:hypothetical protein